MTARGKKSVSSTAEYLTFVASVGKNNADFEVRYEDENIRLTQKMKATLYDVDVRTIFNKPKQWIPAFAFSTGRGARKSLNLPSIEKQIPYARIVYSTRLPPKTRTVTGLSALWLD